MWQFSSTVLCTLYPYLFITNNKHPKIINNTWSMWATILRSGGVPPWLDTPRPLLISDTSLSLKVRLSISLQPWSLSLGRDTSSRPKHSVHHPLTSSFVGFQAHIHASNVHITCASTCPLNQVWCLTYGCNCFKSDWQSTLQVTLCFQKGKKQWNTLKHTLISTTGPI